MYLTPPEPTYHAASTSMFTQWPNGLFMRIGLDPFPPTLVLQAEEVENIDAIISSVVGAQFNARLVVVGTSMVRRLLGPIALARGWLCPLRRNQCQEWSWRVAGFFSHGSPKCPTS